MKSVIRPLLYALLAFIVAAPNAARAAETKPLEVVATFSILGDMVREVGGDLVHVRMLVGPDGDAHVYKPTPDDSKALARADLVVENGLGMEGWIDRLVAASGSKGRIVIASTGVTPREMNGEESPEHGASNGGKAYDPHAWQNLANGRIYIRNIAEALSQLRPEAAKTIQARAQAYDAELAKLDAWVKTEMAAIPAERRKIITSHDAFGYFGAAYGVSFLAPQGVDTEVEPTAAQIARLLKQMKAEKVHTVFFENMASPKLIRQLAKDGGAAVGAPVYSDALSKEGGPAATYTAMFRHNVAQFKAAMATNGL